MTPETPTTCAECNGPAEIEEREWAPVELCVPCAIELRGRPTQADAAAAEQSAAAARDAQWREAVRAMQRGYQDESVDCSFPLNGQVILDTPASDCRCATCATLRALLETKP